MRFHVIKHCPVRVVALSLKLLGIKQGVFYEQDFCFFKNTQANLGVFKYFKL